MKKHKYYVYDGTELKETTLTKEVRRIFYLKRCKDKPCVVFHGSSPLTVEHYRAFELTKDGLKQLTGSRWNFITYEVFLNEKAVQMNWRDFIE